MIIAACFIAGIAVWVWSLHCCAKAAFTEGYARGKKLSTTRYAQLVGSLNTAIASLDMGDISAALSRNGIDGVGAIFSAAIGKEQKRQADRAAVLAEHAEPVKRP